MTPIEFFVMYPAFLVWGVIGFIAFMAWEIELKYRIIPRYKQERRLFRLLDEKEEDLRRSRAAAVEAARMRAAAKRSRRGR